MNFQTNLFVLSLILLTYLIYIGGQDLCDSYKNITNKVMIYSADNRRVFVFIGENFWIVTENDNRLSLTASDRQSNGKIEISTNRMDTIFQFDLEFEDKDDDHLYYLDGFVFYDSATKNKRFPMGSMYIAENGKFEYSCKDGIGDWQELCGSLYIDKKLVKDKFDEQQLRRSVSFPVRNQSSGFAEYVVFLVMDPKPHIHPIDIGIFNVNKTTGSNNYIVEEVIFEPYEIKDEDINFRQQLLNMNDSPPPIGLFLSRTSKNLYAFFNFTTAIKYCTIDNCLKNNFRVLIDCPVDSIQVKDKTSDKFPSVLYVIIGFILFLVILALISCVVCIVIRKRPEAKHKLKGSHSVETVQTLDSLTGDPIPKLSIRSDSSSDRSTVTTKTPEISNS